MIEWSPDLSVGIEEIDAQHRELFRRAARFAEGLETRTREEVAQLLSYLRHYAAVHFAAEEEWMRITAYPGHRLHRAEHERFLRELLSLSGEHVRRGNPGLRSEAVSAWLRRWLVAHLGTHDAALTEFLFQRGAPTAQAEARA
jgi:hemerythrin